MEAKLAPGGTPERYSNELGASAVQQGQRYVSRAEASDGGPLPSRRYCEDQGESVGDAAFGARGNCCTVSSLKNRHPAEYPQTGATLSTFWAG